jgi:hypothetical protein
MYRGTGAAGLVGYMWWYSKNSWELYVWYIEVQVKQV